MNNIRDFWTNILQKWTSLDPPDRLSEVLFGLIMVLTFTGTISVSSAGRQEIDQLIWTSLGCNFAWGLVDAIMNATETVLDRCRNFDQINKIRTAASKEASRSIIRENTSPLLSELMDDDEVDELSERIKKLPEPGKKDVLNKKDFLIAIQIFLLVFLSTFPVALPFMLIKDVTTAMRVSNGVALILMFVSGFALAKYAGLKPFITALIYTAVGVFLVSLTIALGG